MHTLFMGREVRVNQKTFYLGGSGGMKDNAPAEIENNVNPITETLGWGGVGCSKRASIKMV